MIGWGGLKGIPPVQASKGLSIDGSVALKRRPTFMAKLNESILVVAEGYQGLEFVDISNPARPKIIGEYRAPDFPEAQTPKNYAWQFTIRYPYVYLAGGIMGLEILDLSDPTVPVRCSRYYNGGIFVQVELFDDVAVFYNFLGELNYLNISDPFNPVNLGMDRRTSYNDPVWSGFGFTIHNQFIYGTNSTVNGSEDFRRGKIYTFSTNTTELEPAPPEIDLDPSYLTFGEFASKYGFLLRDYFIVQGDLLYLAHHYFPLEIWNISIPNTPKLVQTVNIDEGATWNILAGQTMLYAVNQVENEEGSYISYLNTSDPLHSYNFTAMEHLTFDSTIQTVAIDDDFAFIGMTGELRIRSLAGFSAQSIRGVQWNLWMGISLMAVVSIVFSSKRKKLVNPLIT
ncbi:hypothetical protein [Candidatus Lokiarchaeum ossiferum]|uniref:hypothetical protein n=1 Tax=Candidatus Lokiarchaeum ossiferum TaxID=2951803 RepID=UPI00352C552B